MLIKEAIPRLEVRSLRAFFATFLSMKALYEEGGIDITKHQKTYTNLVQNIIDQFKPLPKEITDDVGNRLFWNVYQKGQIKEVAKVMNSQIAPENSISL